MPRFVDLKRGHGAQHCADVAHDEPLLPTGWVIRCRVAEPIPQTTTVAGRLSKITLARVMCALDLPRKSGEYP